MTLENLTNKPLIINRLKNLYTFSNQLEVIKYLNEKKYLIDVLLKANQNIREYFTDEQLVLKISSDPEIIGWRRLLIVIHTNLDADAAFDRLKNIDNNWWLDAASKVGNDLEIHIEFNDI